MRAQGRKVRDGLSATTRSQGDQENYEKLESLAIGPHGEQWAPTSQKEIGERDVYTLQKQFCYFNKILCCGYESQVTKADYVSNAQVLAVIARECIVFVQQHILQQI